MSFSRCYWKEVCGTECARDNEDFSGLRLCRIKSRFAVKRSRRWSPAFKISTSQAVASAKRVRTVAQYMSSKQIVDGKEDNGNQKNVNDRFCKVERFNYNLSCNKAHTGGQSWSITCDGTWTGSKDILANGWFNLNNEIASFGPTRVKLGQLAARHKHKYKIKIMENMFFFNAQARQIPTSEWYLNSWVGMDFHYKNCWFTCFFIMYFLHFICMLQLCNCGAQSVLI